MFRNTTRAVAILVLTFASGPIGGAHQPNPVDVVRSWRATERLVRTARRDARLARQSTPSQQAATGPVARQTANGGLERWIEKASGGGGTWRPLDGRPTLRSGGDDDGGGWTDPDQQGPAGTQSELSIAVDSTGQHVVIAMNDFRGFAASPLSVSGFAYSDDGGATFTDGGQLPVTVPTSTLGGQTYPQVYGDPDVKYLGGSTFVYFSLMVARYGPTGLVETLGVHRSTDYGHTWTGPFEVPAATNPNGLVDANGFAMDAADKEFADVDPDSGRVVLSWSNFTSVAMGGVEISVTYSDDLATAATPTWAVRRVIAATAADGQAAIPRFAGNGSPNAYVAWQRYTGYYTDTIAFSRSTDNGVTWSAPIQVSPNFVTMDQVLGNDRVHSFPGMAVDTSTGPYRGSIYLVYANNNTLDGADILFRRSTDGGVTFSAGILLNSRPGGDRAQWFPWITVDRTTGRVYVSYYDQGAGTSGDLTETTFLYSDDGGTTWHKPSAATDRPFHAGYGNDTSQPNLGDYNQAVAQGGELFMVWAGNPQIVSFTDGQPSTQMTVPDVIFKRAPTPGASLRLGTVSAVDAGGNGYIDPGEDVRLTLPLVNYAQNPLFAAGISSIAATLSTSTAGVSVTEDASAYPDAAPGATSVNTADYKLTVSPAFVPGTRIELALTVSSSDGSTTLLHTLTTGTPVATTLLSESFDGVAPGSLPAGWVAAHGAGSNTVPWTTSNTFNAGNNGAFHPNADDAADPALWERLFSPSFVVPTDADYVVVEFDTKYDTENDPNLRTLAYDGFFLRVTDLTTGRTLRSVLAEAFAEELITGDLQHYPRHLPRSGHPSYFEDMSVWAGDSGGIRHVRLKLPGMAGSTAQLRFEFTQDSNSTCADLRPGHPCGVLIDNVVVRSVVSMQADLSVTKSAPSSVLSGGSLAYTLVASNNGVDATRSTASQVTISDPIPAGTTFASVSAPTGWSCQTPSPGNGGTITCTKATMGPGETATFRVVVNVACATPDGTLIANTATVGASSPPDPDLGNNSATATVTVLNPPPSIANASATPALLWPPNHKLVTVTIDYVLSDSCGTLTSSLSVTSSEPITGTGPEDLSPDWIVLDAHHVQLRAERADDGPGRTYTITITATNEQGGTSATNVTVFVPRRGK
jgi:uncharacterized repeat protein (TIGR01451 family)